MKTQISRAKNAIAREMMRQRRSKSKFSNSVNIIVSYSLFREKEEKLLKHKTTLPTLQKSILHKVESLLA
jgi:IS30 family transposase